MISLLSSVVKCIIANFIEALGNVTGKIYSGMLVPIYGIHTNLGTPDEPGAWLHDKA
jgi:hypothetical protein